MDVKIIKYAIDAHDKTNHKYDGVSYSLHLTIASMVAQKFIHLIPIEHQESVLNAVWLHDTIEDARLTFNDVKKVAGEDVANLVFAVSNEKGKGRNDRANKKYYTEMAEVPYARFVKLCDRYANVLYSSQTKSSMLVTYQLEHEKFLKMMFPIKRDSYAYAEMIDELNALFYDSEIYKKGQWKSS